MSPSVRPILGYDPDDLVGDQGYEYVHPEDREANIETVERALKQGGSGVAEVRFRRADGTWCWIESTLRDITLPHMKNALLFVVIASTIFQFQVFGQPFLMTDGGPVGETETLVVYLYELGFRARELGFGAAVGYTLLAILVGVSILNYVLVGTNDE